jgi:hypothetical protein
MTAIEQRATPTRSPGWRGALAPAAMLVPAAAALGFVARVDPNAPGHYPTCPFLWLTGEYCPGCGSLRAVHALTHGDLGTAMSRNPLTVLGTVALVVLWIAWLQRRVTGRPRRAAPAWVLWALLAVVLAFWLLRNLPGFEWLAP